MFSQTVIILILLINIRVEEARGTRLVYANDTIPVERRCNCTGWRYFLVQCSYISSNYTQTHAHMCKRMQVSNL